MRGRGFYRSVTFWAGLMVMLSLGWAWWDSLGCFGIASYGRVAGWHAGGGLKLQVNRTDWPGNFSYQAGRHIPDVHEGDGGRRDLFFTRIGKEEAIPAWPGMMVGTGLHGPWVFLAYWMILMGAGAVWVGLLVWRRKTKFEI